MYRFGETSAEIFDLHWSGPPKPEFAGVQSLEPIYVVASATTPEIVVDFYATNSNSFPFESKDGWWENLLPTWKFCDRDGNPVNHVRISGTSAEFEGELSGNVYYEYKYPVWYVDQRASSPKRPIHLWATMNLSAMGVVGEAGEYPGYANSNICDITVARISTVYPDTIRFTIDGDLPLSSEYHWTDTVVPFIGTAHSSYFDSLYLSADKLSFGNGIIYDYPVSDSVRLPFKSAVRTHTTVLSAETGDYMRLSGELVYDEEGLPIPDIEPIGYLYERAPVTAYDKGLGSTASAYTETSSIEDVYKFPSAKQYAIPGTEVEYIAPAFNKYDNRTGDNYYIGGYFIGNVTMPDTARTSGELFYGSAPMDPGASSYMAPHAAWVSAPFMGAMYRVFPTGEITPEEKRELEKRGYPIPGGRWAMAPSSPSSLGAENLMLASAEMLTSSQNYLKDTMGWPVAYHLSGVQGIYCTAVDVNYNLWGVDEERGHVYKISPNGELVQDIDLNAQLSALILASGDQDAMGYFGVEGSTPWRMDMGEKSLQPSWICLSPKQSMEIYIGYHSSYLVTKHDENGNMVDYDCSNPIAYRGTKEQRSRTSSFPAFADNANKPCVLAFGEDNDIWATYSSTSVGYETIGADDGDRVSSADQCRICLYENGIIRHADKSNSINFSFGKNIVDMCVYDGTAYVLTMDENDVGELVSVYKTTAGLGSTVLVGADEKILRPGHLSISNDGKCWFHGFNRSIYCYDTKDRRFYRIDEDAVQLYELDDKLYVKEPFAAIDGMSVDSDGYIWIIDNLAVNNIQRIDTERLIDWVTQKTDQNPGCGAESIAASNRPFALYGAKSRTLRPSGVFTASGIDWKQEWVAGGTTSDVPFVLANGDWTGIKLELGLNQIVPSSCSAESGNIYLQDHKHFNFRKYNESWDLVDNMKKNILVPKFRDASQTFWDEYAENMVGGVDNSTYPIGRRLFERIANIVPNLHDVEDSTVMGLQSMALAQDVPMDKYDIHFPEAMNRMVDLFSCRHERIWGDRCHCDKNYTETLRNSRNKSCFCTACGHWHKSNCGDQFDPAERSLIADRSAYLVRNKMESRSKFMKIVPTEKSVEDAKLVLYKILTRQWVYDDSNRFAAIPDDFAESVLLAQDYNTQLVAVHTQFFIEEPWYDMCFWKFEPTMCSVQNIGLVHWDDEWTTFPESLSGVEAFYDNPDPAKDRATGYAAMTFQWLLYKGLGFALSGTST